MFKSKKRWKLKMLCLCVIVFSLSGYAAAQSLCECAVRGDLEKIKLLILEGADVNMINRAGVTPLHFAADRGHKEVVQLLISKGADVNAVTKYGITPLTSVTTPTCGPLRSWPSMPLPARSSGAINGRRMTCGITTALTKPCSTI